VKKTVARPSTKATPLMGSLSTAQRSSQDTLSRGVIISQHFPSTLNTTLNTTLDTTIHIGCDKVIAYLPNTKIDRRLIHLVFQPTKKNPNRLVRNCVDPDGRNLKLVYMDGSFGDMLRLVFNPNQILHGHNAFAALPDDTDTVLDLVDGLIKRHLWILGLPSVRSDRWKLSGVDYNADRRLPPYLLDCLGRAFQALPFLYSSKDKAFNDDTETWLDENDRRFLESFYTMNGGKVQTLVHNIYDKEKEFAEHHPALVHLVRGVVRDEIRVRGKRTLKLFGFKRLTIEQALRRSDRVAVFQQVLERHGLSDGFFAGAADAPIGKSDHAKKNRRGVLLAGSFGLVKAARTIQCKGKPLAKDTVNNIRREQRNAGQVHFDTDVNWVLRWYATEIFQSPAGSYFRQADLDTPDNDALDAAIRLKLYGKQMESTPKNAAKPRVAALRFHRWFPFPWFLSRLVARLSRRRVRFRVAYAELQSLVQEYNPNWPMPP